MKEFYMIFDLLHLALAEYYSVTSTKALKIYMGVNQSINFYSDLIQPYFDISYSNFIELDYIMFKEYQIILVSNDDYLSCFEVV